jgi:hypothetical protein
LTEDDLERLDDPENSRMGSVLRLEDLDTIINLHNFSLAMIHYPWTERLFKRLVAMKNNQLFRRVFMLSHFLQSRSFVDIGFTRTIVEGYYHRIEN